MVVFLLVLIVLILLFGASALLATVNGILGWLATIVLLTITYVWLGQYISAAMVLATIGTIGALSGLGLWWLDWSEKQRYQGTVLDPSAKHLRRGYDPAVRNSLPDARPVERIWARFADDITSRFDQASQLEAKRLFEENNVRGLYQFCQTTLERLR